MTRILFSVGIFLLISAPAWACPVCFEAKGGTLNAFRFSTVLLSLIPLIVFASFFYWYRRKAKDLDSH